MRAFAAAWSDATIVQRAVAQLPWRQNIAPLEKLEDPELRRWYAREAIKHGWSQPVLLPREREMEETLVDHIQRFLLELGSGFAFVGRQIRLQVGHDDFYVDLLFYHLKLRCHVVVELKAVSFEPGFVGQPSCPGVSLVTFNANSIE